MADGAAYVDKYHFLGIFVLTQFLERDHIEPGWLPRTARLHPKAERLGPSRWLTQSPDEGRQLGVMCNLEGTMRIIGRILILTAG